MRFLQLNHLDNDESVLSTDNGISSFDWVLGFRYETFSRMLQGIGYWTTIAYDICNFL